MSVTYSNYYTELEVDARRRYDEKLKLIKVSEDPYCYFENRSRQPERRQCIEWFDWPDIAYGDIYNYLILTPSYYTHEQLKAYKSLDGYNSFANGWVSDVHVSKATEDSRHTIFLFTGTVKHSQSLSATPLKVWIATYSSGEVVCAHCTCMAGIGEACSHIAALLFTAEANTQVKSQFSCTSLPCSWLPPSFRKVPYSEISQIDFTTPKHKRKLSLDIPPASQESIDKYVPRKKVFVVPEPTDEDKRKFYLDLSKSKGSPVILALIADFSDPYVPVYEKGVIPKPLTNLNDAAAMRMTYPDLLQRCEEVFSSISFSFNQAQLVEENTRMQSNCKLWFQQRAGRITASRFREVLHTDFSQPSLSLIKSICYPAEYQFTTVPCQYGLDNEDKARSVYFEKFVERHDSLMIIKSGLILNPSYPFMGATPDGIVHCSCCGTGTLEIKCPYSCRERSFEDVANEHNLTFCLYQDEDGSLYLKKEHAYYYQIQMQMQLSQVNYCDFVLWREGEIFH